MGRESDRGGVNVIPRFLDRFERDRRLGDREHALHTLLGKIREESGSTGNQRENRHLRSRSKDGVLPGENRPFRDLACFEWGSRGREFKSLRPDCQTGGFSARSVPAVNTLHGRRALSVEGSVVGSPSARCVKTLTIIRLCIHFHTWPKPPDPVSSRSSGGAAS